MSTIKMRHQDWDALTAALGTENVGFTLGRYSGKIVQMTPEEEAREIAREERERMIEEE